MLHTPCTILLSLNLIRLQDILWFLLGLFSLDSILYPDRNVKECIHVKMHKLEPCATSIDLQEAEEANERLDADEQAGKHPVSVFGKACV